MQNEQLEKVLRANLKEEELIQDMIGSGRLRNFKEGETVMQAGSNAREMPVVLSGLLKVMRDDEEGNEIFLYFLEGGETCAMSMTCCFENKPAHFHVVAEEDAELWMLPIDKMDEWVQKYQSFRRFVFSSYQERFDELLDTIHSVVFLRMEDRIFQYLLDLKQASGNYVITKTHREIAQDLNTSRVVVSRLLKKLEEDGKIEHFRNRIEIL
jgi:CRP/FNR family transcriptional regulator